MIKAKLGDICNIVSGGTPSRSKSEFWDGGTVPWIKIGDIKSKYVDSASESITKLGLDNSAAKLLEKGTILYTIFATLGEVGILNIDACTNQAIVGITAKDRDTIKTDYLYYFLKSKKRYVDMTGRGVAQNNINLSILRDFEVAIPSVETQERILSFLNKTQSIISCYKQQLAKLDELVKARFVEMFGDRYTNDKKWNNKPLHECADFYNGKAHEQVIDENGEYILVTSRCIASNISDYRRTNALLFPLQVNDIAMVMSDVPNGRALAKCILIDEDGKYTLNQRICCLRNYSFNPIFFYHLLNRHEYFLSFNDGNVQTNLRKDDLLACTIIIPPLELQEQFATFVKQVDKSKLAVQKALGQAQLLFDNLMQKYFG